MIGALLAAVLATAPVGVSKAPYGITRGGEAVDRYTLRNPRGIEVAVLTYGGIITEISVPDRAGRFGNVVLALPDLAAYEARANFGSIVGRYANRIAHGGFTVDGTRHALSPDPDAVVAHGGKGSFGAKVWRAEPCRRRRCTSVTMRYTSADGENGFPGRLEVAVTYALDADALRLDYTATTDRPTVINLTNHSYFNLAGMASGDVRAQRLQVMADRVAVADAHRVPTGELRPVAGTPFDLRTPVTIGARIDAADPQIVAAKGFDHGFVLDRPLRERLPVAARAVDDASGRTIEVRTTEPALHLYTAGGFDGSLKGAGGRGLPRAAGFALETQHLADSPNQPSFPSTVLRPGQIFRSTTIYRFGVARGGG